MKLAKQAQVNVRPVPLTPPAIDGSADLPTRRVVIEGVTVEGAKKELVLAVVDLITPDGILLPNIATTLESPTPISGIDSAVDTLRGYNVVLPPTREITMISVVQGHNVFEALTSPKRIIKMLELVKKWLSVAGFLPYAKFVTVLVQAGEVGYLLHLEKQVPERRRPHGI
jgi:hypothetical protein